MAPGLAARKIILFLYVVALEVRLLDQEMDNVHKAFLQAFMRKGVQNAREVKELFKKCCEQYNEPYCNDERERSQHLVGFIRKLNENIEPFHLEVKKGICEEDGANFYCLVNNVENNITRLAADYTPTELDFFKKLVEIIVENDGSTGSMEALNIVEHLEKKMTKQEAESLLERLQLERWVLQKNGLVSLTVRSILELNQYIQQVFPDYVKVCNICKVICLKGHVCEECGIKIHHHCAVRYFSKLDVPTCPDKDCAAVWKFAPDTLCHPNM